MFSSIPTVHVPFKNELENDKIKQTHSCNSFSLEEYSNKRVNSVTQISNSFPRYSPTFSCVVITLLRDMISKIVLNLWFASVIKLYKLIDRIKSYNPVKIC